MAASDYSPRHPSEYRLPALYPRSPPHETVDLAGPQALPLCSVLHAAAFTPGVSTGSTPRLIPRRYQPSPDDWRLGDSTPSSRSDSAGYTLTRLIGCSRLLRPAGLTPSLGCVRPHLAVEPSRTLYRSCFDGASCPATLGPRRLGRIGAFPRRAPFIPLEQRLRPRSIVGVPRVLHARQLAAPDTSLARSSIASTSVR